MNEDKDNINCTPEETTRRLSFCMPCESNVLDVISKCKECDCSLSILASFNFKTCPLEKW